MQVCGVGRPLECTAAPTVQLPTAASQLTHMTHVTHHNKQVVLTAALQQSAQGTAVICKHIPTTQHTQLLYRIATTLLCWAATTMQVVPNQY
jgi:hypothetical protein